MARRISTLVALLAIATVGLATACDPALDEEFPLLWGVNLQLPADQTPPERQTLTLRISQRDADTTGLPTQMSFRGNQRFWEASGTTRWMGDQGTVKRWCFQDPLILHNSAADTTTRLAPAGTCTATNNTLTFPPPPGAFPLEAG